MNFAETQVVEWDEHIKEVSSSQIISNVQQYATDAQRLINDNLQKMFNINGLKKEIKDCVIGAFNLASREFNENEILAIPRNRRQSLRRWAAPRR